MLLYRQNLFLYIFVATCSGSVLGPGPGSIGRCDPRSKIMATWRRRFENDLSVHDQKLLGRTGNHHFTFLFSAI